MRSKWVLMFLQLIGMAICAWLKYKEITPMADMMGRSARWDFTVDIVGGLLILGPALWACIQRIPHWHYPVILACVPALLITLATVYFTGSRLMREASAKRIRLERYDSAEKVEQIIGLPFPAFSVTKADENDLSHDEYYLPRYICTVEAEFNTLPSADFYQKLDSLCELESSLWKKKDNIYLFDSIFGQVTLSELILSLVLERDKKALKMEYDVMNLK